MANNVYRISNSAVVVICPMCKLRSKEPMCATDNIPTIPESALDTDDIFQGQVVGGRYVLLHRIGEGAVAEVYASWDRTACAEVAVKLMKHNLSGDAVTMARFKREAAAISRLQHPNIVRLTGAGRFDDGIVYLVLERLVGRTLAELIQAEAPVAPAKAAQIIAEVCDAVDVTHAHGIMHRDLKPANIFLAKNGDGTETVKLLDFGIARGLRDDPVDERLSGGKVLGSVCYAAPEQALRKTLDQRTDLYAVGVLLYELLSGRLPFDSDDPLRVLKAHVSYDVPPLPARVPEPFRWLCSELLAKNPDFRPRDGHEVAVRLREMSVGLPHSADGILGALLPERPPIEAPEGLEPIGTGAAQSKTRTRSTDEVATTAASFERPKATATPIAARIRNTGASAEQPTLPVTPAHDPQTKAGKSSPQILELDIPEPSKTADGAALGRALTISKAAARHQPQKTSTTTQPAVSKPVAAKIHPREPSVVAPLPAANREQSVGTQNPPPEIQQKERAAEKRTSMFASAPTREDTGTNERSLLMKLAELAAGPPEPGMPTLTAKAYGTAVHRDSTAIRVRKTLSLIALAIGVLGLLSSLIFLSIQ
ncbi:MAG: protein kinase [Myxococcales bacterium]|nr:protein kinase [Myxococcales bacterium]